MDKRTVGVIGHFGYGKKLVNGQTIKAKIITDELKKNLGEENVETIDSSIGIKGIVSLFFRVGVVMSRCKNIIMLPAHNGLIYFSIVLCFWKCFFKVNLHYIVIGGWLVNYLENKKIIAAILKQFDHIFVENTITKLELENKGFRNVVILSNCKSLNIIKISKGEKVLEKPYRLCILSRVMYEKGIEDAIFAISKINDMYEEIRFCLDIYGPIEKEYIDNFNKLLTDNAKFIKYKGIVSYNETNQVIRKYDFLLFPTRFFEEGVPGTIIDAYASGVPVIFSKWKHWKDLMEDGKTGYGYEFGSLDSLTNILSVVAREDIDYYFMQTCCIKRAGDYQASKVIQYLVKFL